VTLELAESWQGQVSQSSTGLRPLPALSDKRIAAQIADIGPATER